MGEIAEQGSHRKKVRVDPGDPGGQLLRHLVLGTALDPDRHLATSAYPASSWARPEIAVRERDVAAADAILDAAGWPMASDGVRMRESDGTRLSTTIAVRPTSVDLFTFANQAAAQLAECGIELLVEELDLTGDTMLTQLRWPNDFDAAMCSSLPGVGSGTRVIPAGRAEVA